MKPANNAPIYACVYRELAELTREHGYALAVHGSLARDLDVTCIPWVEKPSDPAVVVAAIAKGFALRPLPKDPETKLHGRIVYGFTFMGEIFVDLSFMPRMPAGEHPHATALRGIASCATACPCCRMHQEIAAKALEEAATPEPTPAAIPTTTTG